VYDLKARADASAAAEIGGAGCVVQPASTAPAARIPTIGSRWPRRGCASRINRDYGLDVRRRVVSDRDASHRDRLAGGVGRRATWVDKLVTVNYG